MDIPFTHLLTLSSVVLHAMLQCSTVSLARLHPFARNVPLLLFLTNTTAARVAHFIFRTAGLVLTPPNVSNARNLICSYLMVLVLDVTSLSLVWLWALLSALNVAIRVSPFA